METSVNVSDGAAISPLPATGASGTARERGRHIVELDGIRAIAIWLVLIAHLLFTEPTTPAGRAFVPAALAAILTHGWLGVDLFFVLSGFLITGILLRTKDLGRANYFRRFYLRRALRILPLCFVVLLVCFAAFGGRYGSYLALCAVMLANLAGLLGIDIPDAAGPFWSLAVEEQFYLVWPWLVLWLDARKLIVTALVIIIAEPIFRAFASSEWDITLTWYRLDGLAMGALLAAWFAAWDGDKRSARNLCFALVGSAIAVSIAGQPFGLAHGGAISTSLRITQAVLCFGALVAAAVLLEGHPALAPLRSRFAVTTAMLSYCLYLIHRPLIDAFSRTIGTTAWFARLPAEEGTLLRVVTVLAVGYGLAALSRRFLELPFQRLGRAGEAQTEIRAGGGSIGRA